jgi:hypothetical protein
LAHAANNAVTGIPSLFFSEEIATVIENDTTGFIFRYTVILVIPLIVFATILLVSPVRSHNKA